MNEIKEIIVKGRIISKNDILDNPAEYRNQTMICLSVGREYLNSLKAYSTEVNLDNPLEIKMKPWPEDITERARKFFFTLRDRLAKVMGDETRPHKDHLYRSCVMEQAEKQSLTELNKQELWQCTELMFKWCYENGAYIGNLDNEKKEIQRGIL